MCNESLSKADCAQIPPLKFHCVPPLKAWNNPGAGRPVPKSPLAPKNLDCDLKLLNRVEKSSPWAASCHCPFMKTHVHTSRTRCGALPGRPASHREKKGSPVHLPSPVFKMGKETLRRGSSQNIKSRGWGSKHEESPSSLFSALKASFSCCTSFRDFS